jgi:hypothetical protein
MYFRKGKEYASKDAPLRPKAGSKGSTEVCYEVTLLKDGEAIFELLSPK